MQRVRQGCPEPSVLSSAWFFSKIQNIAAGPSQNGPFYTSTLDPRFWWQSQL